MAVSDLVNLSGLIDDAKCFGLVRQHRWPECVRCPVCDSDAVIRDGCDDTQPCRQRYRCKACVGRFDDLTGLDAALRHLPPGGSLRDGAGRAPPAAAGWVLCLYLMGLNLSNRQIALAQNQQFGRRNNTAHAYLLRALVSCGVCGLSCSGRCSSPGYRYYQCRGKLAAVHSHRDTICPSRHIPAAQLDALVWDDLCQVLTHPETIRLALERAHGGHWLPQELPARCETLRRGQANLQRQVERLTEAYLAGVVGLEEYQRRRRDLEQRGQALAGQERQLEAQVDRQVELARLSLSMKEFCGRVSQGLEQASWEQKRQLIEWLVARVVVTDGEVEIRYVIPTSPAGEAAHFCHLRSDYRAPNQPP